MKLNMSFEDAMAIVSTAVLKPKKKDESDDGIAKNEIPLVQNPPTRQQKRYAQRMNEKRKVDVSNGENENNS